MERTQFTFYESFFKAISRIKKDADRGKAYDAICAYALYGIEPDVDSLPDAAAIAFELSKPNLDASRRKASNGKKGGESKQSESKAETNEKQTASKKEKENKKEIEIENKCYIPQTPLKFSPPSLADVRAYCAERGNGVDPERWYNHYTANGWMVGKNKMKDWKAAVRTWEQKGDNQRDRSGNGSEPSVCASTYI